jgi:hypothetical protein
MGGVETRVFKMPAIEGLSRGSNLRDLRQSTRVACVAGGGLGRNCSSLNSRVE